MSQISNDKSSSPSDFTIVHKYSPLPPTQKFRLSQPNIIKSFIPHPILVKSQPMPFMVLYRHFGINHYPVPTRPDRKTTVLALTGATLTFLFLSPILMFILNGAIAIGVYHLIKRLYPAYRQIQDSKKRSQPQIIEESNVSENASSPQNIISNIFGNFPLPGFADLLSQTTSIASPSFIDKLYNEAIAQIDSFLRDARYNDLLRYGFGAEFPTAIHYTKPYSFLTSKIATFNSSLGGKHQEQNMEVEFNVTSAGQVGIVRAKGTFSTGNMILKEIAIYWPETGKHVSIPITKITGANTKEKDEIPEAEFRDVK